jgi:zinc protease
MRVLHSTLLAAVLALPGTLASAAENVTSFMLDNGLQLVVIEDHRAAAVTHMAWYKVGSADEPPGKSGIAHYLEHLMFKGTDDLAPGEFSETVRANGGSDNAFTSWDYTGYFQRIAADRLGLMMQMEADRMRDLRLTEEDVAPELQVILEERSQRTDSNPGGLFGEQRRAALYLNHPYGRPIIGWRHEMEGLTRDDAKAFYFEHYAPNNAIIIVAGDVYPEDALALAQLHYGPLTPNPDLAKRVRPTEPPHIAERRVIYEDPRVSTPYVIRSYLAPERDAGAQETAAALTFLAEILGGSSQTSVLGQALQFGEATALFTSAFYSGLALDSGEFGVLVAPVAGRSLQDAEADMDRVIAEFMETGVNVEQFERIKMQIRASEIYDRDSVQGTARRYGAALTSGLAIADVQAWPDVLQAVTPEDVMTAAELVFDRRKAVTGYLLSAETPVTEVTQ